MATVLIPALLRDLTAGLAEVQAPGRTVGELVTALEARYPGLRERLCEGERLDPTLVVAVDGRVSRRGLAQPVEEASEVQFILAVGGG